MSNIVHRQKWLYLVHSLQTKIFPKKIKVGEFAPPRLVKLLLSSGTFGQEEVNAARNMNKSCTEFFREQSVRNSHLAFLIVIWVSCQLPEHEPCLLGDFYEPV